MNNNTARYRVDIPCYIVVYLDNDLRPVSHDLDIDQAILYPNEGIPTVMDFWDRNSDTPKIITEISEALDEYNNALDYARGLHIHHARQIMNVGSVKDLLDSKEPF